MIKLHVNDFVIMMLIIQYIKYSDSDEESHQQNSVLSGFFFDASDSSIQIRTILIIALSKYFFNTSACIFSMVIRQRIDRLH